MNKKLWNEIVIFLVFIFLLVVLVYSFAICSHRTSTWYLSRYVTTLCEVCLLPRGPLPWHKKYVTCLLSSCQCHGTVYRNVGGQATPVQCYSVLPPEFAVTLGEGTRLDTVFTHPGYLHGPALFYTVVETREFLIFLKPAKSVSHLTSLVTDVLSQNGVISRL